jgi:YD repeat-containing protein
MTVTLTDPANNVTEYFYSTWPGANWSYNGTGGYDPSLNGFTLAEYGQPFTRRVSSGGAFLSRRVYSAAGYAASPRQPLRSFYVQPDRDATACESLDSNCLQANQRMKFERTVYDDDGGATADVSYDDFDGLGHYRRMVAGGSFGSSIETITDYNKRNSGINPTTGIDSGTYPGAFAMPSPATPWILDRASKVTRTANRTQVEQQCYDETTGLLLARRALAGDSAITSNDMLALFQYAAGNLVVESYYGGDKKANAPTAAGTTLCGIVSSPPSSYEYRLTHEYTAGVRKKTQYAGVSFLALNRTIDPATGLTVSEKDVSGQKTTTYGYDTSWRSTSVAPPDDTASSIVYTNSSGTAPATVSVTAGSAQETYRYDGLGHLWRQKRLMPNGSWSLRETQHNALGWITQSSEFETIPAGVDEFAFTPSHWTVFSDFDGLGRVGKITSPAADVVTVTYVGARKTTRQQKIATSPTDQTPVSTVEEADSHGRLVKIVENDGAANAAATAYTYDVTGRLATVKWQTATESDLQPRTLTYDGRGLLTGEQHPESGTTAYLYDSRGHVTSRTTPVATLTMDYDAAERLQTVSQTGSGILKQFTYDRANTASDFSFGKLAAATRHNYVLNRDISVTETYKYEQDGGRVSSRQSSVSGYGTFSDAYAYDDYGHVTSITYPACPACAGLNAPARTVISLFTGDYLTAVQGYTSQTSPMTYDGNGLLTGIRHLDVGGTPGPLYTQTPDNGLARPQQIKVEDYCDFGLHTPLQPKSVQAGSPANLTVDAPDAATFQWYERVNGADSLLSGQTTATLTTIINSTRFFWVRAGNGDCTVDSGVVQVSATVTVNPPTNVIALATGPNAVQVTWSYSGSADSFRVERTGAPNGWAPSGSNAASPHVDPTPLANHAYLYRVIAIKNGVESVPSAPDLATTIVFDSIVPSTTVRRAQQILQLRTAANAVTALAGLPAPSFTDPDLAGRSMRLEHVTEPKAAIDQALSQLFGRPPIAYSGPPPTRGGVTRAEHLTKLQDAVK